MFFINKHFIGALEDVTAIKRRVEPLYIMLLGNALLGWITSWMWVIIAVTFIPNFTALVQPGPVDGSKRWTASKDYHRCGIKTCCATNNWFAPTLSSPVIGTKGKVNLPIPRIPVKLQINLLHLGLCPIGKGALVVTGGPSGAGADGRFRRLEVGLCIVWLAVAVTVSLLSLLLRGSSIPSAPLICFFLQFSLPESQPTANFV